MSFAHQCLQPPSGRRSIIFFGPGLCLTLVGGFHFMNGFCFRRKCGSYNKLFLRAWVFCTIHHYLWSVTFKKHASPKRTKRLPTIDSITFLRPCRHPASMPWRTQVANREVCTLQDPAPRINDWERRGEDPAPRNKDWERQGAKTQTLAP